MSSQLYNYYSKIKGENITFPTILNERNCRKGEKSTKFKIINIGFLSLELVVS